MKALHIDGNNLQLAELREVVYERRPVLLAPDAREAVERSRRVVEELVAQNQVAYAITTGVGKLSDVRIDPQQNRELQLNLIRSHCVGVGEPLSEADSRAMMLLRANSLAKGYSGVRPLVIDSLCEMLNRGVHPVIPSQGSVGASGDLAPLAHLALALIGEGPVIFEGKQMAGSDALSRAQIKPLILEAKEAISLINGTQGMLALGTLALLAAETLVDSADVIAALSCDALRGTDVAFDERIQKVRPHPGQARSAQNLRRMLEGSQIRESHRECGRVQDAYSLRCIPQVHGAVRDALAYCREVMEIEMNSAVDNPLVFVANTSGPRPDFSPAENQKRGFVSPHDSSSGRDLSAENHQKRGFVSGHDLSRAERGQKESGALAPGNGEVLSGGNFHGEPVAFALDFLAIALSALAGISERRVERLVNPMLNEGLPPFLAADAGMNSGFMMAQVTAAALVSENKVLAHPASVDSITTSGNKEDYVSMGMAAALKLKKIVQNSTNVLAIEALAAAQALDFLAPLKPGKRGQQAVAAIRAVSPKLEKDRVLAQDFAKMSAVISAGKLAEALR